MNRLGWVSLGLVAVVVCGMLAGCGPAGPSTAPVKGTLTINGQPADNVFITFVSPDPARPSASGLAKGGAFELYTGSEGKKGAVPGKYKVVLAKSGGGMEAAMAAYKSGGAGGKKSEAPKADSGGIPVKYTSVTTSDKEVEVTSGSNDIKIEITGE